MTESVLQLSVQRRHIESLQDPPVLREAGPPAEAVPVPDRRLVMYNYGVTSIVPDIAPDPNKNRAFMVTRGLSITIGG